MFPVISENGKLNLALAITVGAPTTVTTAAIETPPLVADETNKYLLNSEKQ